MTTTIPARDWELTCHKCDGSGHVYVKHQVAERKTDMQEFKEECECCEGRGFVFAFQDIPGIEEYVKTCRPASSAPGVSTVAQQVKTDGQNVGQIVDDYIQEYELRGEDEEGRDGVYSPNETERYMIADAIYGLLANDEFMALMRRPAPAAGDSLDAHFDLWQDDMVVASASGPRSQALEEIQHYATVYGQDGPVQIEEVIRIPLSDELAAQRKGGA